MEQMSLNECNSAVNSEDQAILNTDQDIILIRKIAQELVSEITSQALARFDIEDWASDFKDESGFTWLNNQTRPAEPTPLDQFPLQSVATTSFHANVPLPKFIPLSYELSDTFIALLFEQNTIRERSRYNHNRKTKFKWNRKNVAKKKRQHRSTQALDFPSYEEMGFWTEADLKVPLDDSHVCAVCMEIYFRPHLCLPCEHVFCESCLRRLSKYCDTARILCVCPICRRVIERCMLDEAKLVEIKTARCFDYERRQRYEERSRFMSFALPRCSRECASKQDVIAAAVSRRRQNCESASRKRRTKVVRALLLIALVVTSLYVISVLMKWTDNEVALTQWFLGYWTDLLQYSHLDSSGQLMVTNKTVAILSFLSFLFTLFYYVT